MERHGDQVRRRLTVAICIPTFRRPVELARLIEMLPAVIDTARSEGRLGEVEIIVVDNDAEQSARDAVRETGVTVRYVVERDRGVVAVRNRALDEAAGHEVAVFIDDDETPEDAGWLARLLEARERFDAVVVAGPVRTVTDEPLDPWIVAGGFFARAHRAGLPTGSPIARAATNNLLLDLKYVEDAGIRFDSRFGRSGGEDSLFTSQLHARGARMVWCAEAAVLDHLPVERRTRAHALERTQGMANAGVRVGLALATSPSRRFVVRAKAVVAGCIHWTVGAIQGILGLIVRNERLHATGAKARARARGSLTGAGNRRLEIYGGAGA